MRRAVPWIIAAVAVATAAMCFSELSKWRVRYAEAIKPINFHVHRNVREFMIRASFEGLTSPIVVFGDSITEMTRLPESIDGLPVVNAGVGGAAIGDFVQLAPRLLDGIKPSLCVIALGANDALGYSASVENVYSVLLSKLRSNCPRFLAISVPPMQRSDLVNSQIRAAAISADVPFAEVKITPDEIMQDHIHPNAAGRRAWANGLATTISMNLHAPED